MATSDIAADDAWGALASLESAEREAKMVQLYGELVVLSQEERQSQMLAMARAEYALTDQALRPFTVSRLRAWLTLEPEVAQQIAAAYDAAMLKMSGTHAMRRVALVQTLVRDFSSEDQERLVALVPRVFAGVPTASAAALAQSMRGAEREAEQAASQQKPAKKGWWPFGKR